MTDFMEDLTQEERELVDGLVDADAKSDVKYKWDEEFQREILALLLADRYFLVQCVSLISPKYFVNDAHQLAARIAIKHFNKYKQVIGKTQLFQEMNDVLVDKDEDRKSYYRAEINTVLEYYIPGLDTREYYQDKITNFAKQKTLQNAFSVCLEKISRSPEDEGVWAEVQNILREAMTVERNFDIGLDYFKTFEERYERMKSVVDNKEVFTSGFPAIDKALACGGLTRGEMGSWMGLCFRKGTKVLMYDGTIKNVEDVRVGDLVMGDDSTPRKVLRLSSGVAPLYEVKPVKGASYFVTGNHILALKNCHKTKLKRSDRKGKRYSIPLSAHPSKVEDKNLYQLSVVDFLNQSKHFQKSMKTFRVGVEFSEKSVKIDPYILGLWLGDGDKHQSAFTSADFEVVRALKEEAASRDLIVVGKDDLHYSIVSEAQRVRPCGKGISANTLMNDLRSYDLLYNFRIPNDNEKHIPFDYKINSRKVRLELLAGLMDSDGSASCGGFDFVNKNKTLAEDVVFLARSLGFAAYMNPTIKKCQTGAEGLYWRVVISGDCSEIPTRILRKKCDKRRQIKDVLVSGIDVNYAGDGEFYGFEVDGNHLFLLDDFTVVHNSGTGKSLALVRAAIANMARGKKVLYVSLEIDQDKTAERFDAQLANDKEDKGVTVKTLYDNKDVVFDALRQYVADYEDQTRLVVKQFPAGAMDVATFRAYYVQLSLRNFKPDLVIIDYIGEMKDLPNMKTYESRYRTVRDLRGFAVEEQVCVLTAMQPDRRAREAVKQGEYIDDENLADSYGQVRPLDALWSINQVQDEKDAGLARVFVIKHRHGKSRFAFHVEFNYSTLGITEITQEKYENRLKKYRNEKDQRASEDVKETMQAEELKRLRGKKSNKTEKTEEKPNNSKKDSDINDVAGKMFSEDASAGDDPGLESDE